MSHFLTQNLVVPDKNLSLKENAIAPWAVSQNRYQMQALESLAVHYKFSIHYPFCRAY